jgi:CO/xanthine dehydrogenase Mo-binding subunit
MVRQAVKRVEDRPLITGRGHYVDDIRLAGTLHASFVRSAHAHARVRGIDATAARALSGVHLILTMPICPKPRGDHGAAGAESGDHAALHAADPGQGRGLLRG